ncbi:glutamate--tRNA ligase [Gammaproteobacteria bacterium]|nr:glutamate--tRNA ligase [Gammaproteobacteria bacterium]
MSRVRTRIAPSPTGDPHVGTAYIALFNKCFAHQNNGDFVLRVEDTDQARSTGKSESEILKLLQWLGLTWDEGPNKEGGYGPYRQSERSQIYSNHIELLLDKGKAFHCFCSEERLNALRKEQIANKTQIGYDGHCLGMSNEEVQRKLNLNEPSVIRMKIPKEGDCVFNDLLRGDIKIAWSQIDMQVLMKSDGLPTYHFANVVDDHLMEISHVIRGEEWINSVPKHILLYQYFDWVPPIFCHMPLLRNADKSKLSKRKNPTSIGYYKDMGYLPETLVNYLGMMGWSMPSGEEKFTPEEMITEFDITRVSLGGPTFDIEKLDWLNGKYLREEFSDAEFLEKFGDWISTDKKIKAIVPLIKERVDKFSDVVDLAHFFMSADLAIKADDFSKDKMDPDLVVRILQFSLWRLESLEVWTHDEIQSHFQLIADQLNLKVRDFLFPLFVAVTGSAVSLSVIESITILEINVVRMRLRTAIDLLGGVSKKKQKLLEKAYKDLH